MKGLMSVGRRWQTPCLAFRRNALQSRYVEILCIGRRRHGQHVGLVLSAHRSPEATADFARSAADHGLRVIIAGAGGAAHLAGAIAAHTWLPVLGVPIQSKALQGLDSLLSIAQMPGGVPVGTLAIGASGAKNAALLAVSILAVSDDGARKKLEAFRKKQTDAVLAQRVPK